MNATKPRRTDPWPATAVQGLLFGGCVLVVRQFLEDLGPDVLPTTSVIEVWIEAREGASLSLNARSNDSRGNDAVSPR